MAQRGGSGTGVLVVALTVSGAGSTRKGVAQTVDGFVNGHVTFLEHGFDALEVRAGSKVAAVNNGADVNLRGNSPAHTHDLPLLLVFRRGDIEIFKLLLENGAKVNKKFMTEFLGNPNQIFIDTFPEFKRIIEQELERQRLEKYKRPSDPSWITSIRKWQRYNFEQVLKSFNLSQLKRVYQKVYGKKCPVKSKKAILKILQRK